MTEEKTVPSVEETLYHMNGTFMKDGDSGKSLARTAAALERVAAALEALAGRH